MQKFVLAFLILLSACATWQPSGAVHYRCINTRIEFTIIYAWSPPSAHIEETGHAPLDLAPSPPAGGVGREEYNFGGGSGAAYLNVNRNEIYFVSPGEIPLHCDDVARERVVLTG